MLPAFQWLDDLVTQVREEAEKLHLSQEEVVARLRAGETVEGLFPNLAGTSSQGRTSAYILWELQTHSLEVTHATLLDRHLKVVGMTPGKSGLLHTLVEGKPGSGMGRWNPFPREEG